MALANVQAVSLAFANALIYFSLMFITIHLPLEGLQKTMDK